MGLLPLCQGSTAGEGRSHQLSDSQIVAADSFAASALVSAFVHRRKLRRHGDSGVLQAGLSRQLPASDPHILLGSKWVPNFKHNWPSPTSSQHLWQVQRYQKDEWVPCQIYVFVLACSFRCRWNLQAKHSWRLTSHWSC